MSETKQCRKCGETKPIDDFWKDVTKTDGHDTQCKVCKGLYYQRWGVENRDHKRELNKRAKARRLERLAQEGRR